MIVTLDGSLGSSLDQRTRTSPTFARYNRPFGSEAESVAGQPKRLPMILRDFIRGRPTRRPGASR